MELPRAQLPIISCLILYNSNGYTPDEIRRILKLGKLRAYHLNPCSWWFRVARWRRRPGFDQCPFPCPDSTKCDHMTPYRTIDGSCNNLKYPHWGKAMRPFARELFPDYADGKSGEGELFPYYADGKSGIGRTLPDYADGKSGRGTLPRIW